MEKDAQIKLLADAINEAAEVSSKISVPDLGSSNLDSVTIRLKGWRKSDIRKVNALTRARIHEDALSSAWWKGHRFVDFPCDGQAGLRYAQVQAAYKHLRASCKRIFGDNGCYVSVFYQLD